MLRLQLEIEIIRPDGTTRYKEKQDVNSWVKQAAQHFEAGCKHASVTMKRTTGSNTSLNPASSRIFDTITGATASGILVGTGSTTPDKDDFVIETEIADGSSSGEMDRTNGIQYEGVLGTSTGFTVLLEKTFTNNSGASITINEVVIYYRTGAVLMMGVRDVLATGVVVLAAEAVVVRYFTDWDV